MEKLKFKSGLLTSTILRVSFILIFWSALGLAGDKVDLVALSGQSEFLAETNLSIVNIKGQTQQVSGSLEVLTTAEGIDLKNLTIRVSVESLSTGMGLRDQHMREKIFKTKNGQIPDLTFSSSRSSCKGSNGSFDCVVEGKLKLHGVEKKISLPIRVERRGKNFASSAKFPVKLTDFGVQPPSHFGVKIKNQVQVELRIEGTKTGEAPVLIAAKKETKKELKEIPQPAEEDSLKRAPASLPPPSRTEVGIEIRLRDGTTIKGMNTSQVIKILKRVR